MLGEFLDECRDKGATLERMKRENKACRDSDSYDVGLEKSQVNVAGNKRAAKTS